MDPGNVGLAADHEYLSELARSIPPERGTWRVFHGDLDAATDPTVRGREGEWLVLLEGEGFVMHSPHRDEVAEFLAGLR